MFTRPSPDLPPNIVAASASCIQWRKITMEIKENWLYWLWCSGLLCLYVNVLFCWQRSSELVIFYHNQCWLLHHPGISSHNFTHYKGSLSWTSKRKPSIRLGRFSNAQVVSAAQLAIIIFLLSNCSHRLSCCGSSASPRRWTSGYSPGSCRGKPSSPRGSRRDQRRDPCPSSQLHTGDRPTILLSWTSSLIVDFGCSDLSWWSPSSSQSWRWHLLVFVNPLTLSSRSGPSPSWFYL